MIRLVVAASILHDRPFINGAILMRPGGAIQ